MKLWHLWQRRLLMAMLGLLFAAVGTIAWADVHGDNQATQAIWTLERLQAQRLQARQIYQSPEGYYTDQPAWIAVIEGVEILRQAHPEDMEVLRFAAELYSEIAWYLRAWSAWSSYAQAGGRLSEETQGQATRMGIQLAYNLHTQGLDDLARGYFAEVLQLDPSNDEAAAWLQRLP